MEKLLLSFLCTAGAFFVHAQTASFGLKAGANFYTFTSGDYGDQLSGRTAYHAGVFYRIPLAPLLYLQPELLYSAEGAKIKEDDGPATASLNYLNIPLMLQVQTPDGFYVETGPQIGYLLSATLKSTTAGISVEDDLKENAKTVGLSWGAGAGYWSGNLGLGARYNLGISRLPKDKDDGNDKSSGLQVSLLWRLPK